MGATLVALPVLVAGGWVAPVAATAGEQAEGESSLLIIMDASSSMLAEDVPDGSRMDAARSALRSVVGDLPDELAVGLRVFGANEDDTDREVGCTDTELVMPVGPLDREGLVEAIDATEPRGYTPISESLRQAADDLPSSGDRTVVLVSDGLDTCGPPPPCEVAAELIADGIDVTVQTVGFALGDEPEAAAELECIADATGGEYREADDAAELASAMTTLSARAAQTYDSQARVIEGAAIYRDAPVLELEASYIDTVVGGESRWYAYELDDGQELERVEIIQPGGAETRGSAEVKLHNENGSQQSQPRFMFKAAQTPDVTSAWPYRGLSGPGTYYVEIADVSLEPDEELEYELAVFATGEPAGGPQDDPTDEPTEPSDPTDEPTEPPTGTEPDDDPTAATAGDGATTGLTILVIALLAVVVAMGVALIMVLRKGRST